VYFSYCEHIWQKRRKFPSTFGKNVKHLGALLPTMAPIFSIFGNNGEQFLAYSAKMANIFHNIQCKRRKIFAVIGDIYFFSALGKNGEIFQHIRQK